MREVDPDYKTRSQPAEQATGWTQAPVLLPLPQKTLARRKRLIRYGGMVACLLTIGFSAIPGPKGSSHTVTYATERGVTTQVHHFFFSRHIGLPFTTGRADYNDDGSIKSIKFEGQGLLGNFLVSLAMVILASVFIGRRRPDD